MGTNVGAEMGMDMDMDKKLNMGAPPGFDSDVLPLSRSASGGIGLSSVDVNNWWEPQKVCGDENGLDPGGNWQSGSGYGPGLGDGDGDDVGPPPGLGLQALTGMGMGTGTGTGRELVKEKERGRTWTSNPFFNLGDR
jgi:hypothetical protein